MPWVEFESTTSWTTFQCFAMRLPPLNTVIRMMLMNSSISCPFKVLLFQELPVSVNISKKMCLLSSDQYLVHWFIAACLALAAFCSMVSWMWDYANVPGISTSLVMCLPLAQISVLSGHLPSCISPNKSLMEGNCACFIAQENLIHLLWSCCLRTVFYQAKPCIPPESTGFLHTCVGFTEG